MSTEEHPNSEEAQRDEAADATAEVDSEQPVSEGEVVEEAAETPSTGDAEKDQLIADLEAAETKVNELTDQLVRAQAEQQNMQRRSQRDVENAYKYGIEKFVKDLLAVIDSLERGIESIDPEDETLKVSREGMALTLKMFGDTLVKHSVEELNPLGAPFDPQMHEAMSMAENPDVEPNSVMQVLQKGYTLSGRLVRPAMVIVAKAPAGS